MAVVQRALDHCGNGVQSAEAFVCSGHAFFINIHDEICPSSLYCWDYEPFLERLKNLGLAARVIGVFDPKKPDFGSGVDAEVASEISEGKVCSVLSMDHQLIVDMTEERCQLALPWGEMEVTPPYLTRGSWDEAPDGPPLMFFVFEKCDLAPSEFRRRPAFEFGIQEWRGGLQLELEPQYASGQGAYLKWLRALENGFGEGHGNWWNAMVWSECRHKAAEYLTQWARVTMAG